MIFGSNANAINICGYDSTVLEFATVFFDNLMANTGLLRQRNIYKPNNTRVR